MPFSTFPSDDLAVLQERASVDASAFSMAPVSLWLEDYSGLRALLIRWQAAGMTSLAAYFQADPRRIQECVAQIRVLKVNRMTVELFGGKTEEDFIGPITSIFNDMSLQGLAYEFVELWEGKARFALQSVNRDKSGRHIDVAVTGIVLPGYEQSWERVLIAVQDVTERETARRYARGLFDHSPISLWVEDYSGVKKLLEQLRSRGITDFPEFINLNEEFVLQCLDQVRVIDVNECTLRLFRAPDPETLWLKMREMDGNWKSVEFGRELIDLWEGKLYQQREVTRHTLDGEELYLHSQLSIFPGYEKDWSMMLTALTDITARRNAEAYLEYLGNHDELTKLHNRFFFNDTIKRLHQKGPFPVAVVIIDLNGLKRVNDENGHEAGDALLRRIGDVLGQAIKAPAHACRIGGDEFAILMSATDETGAAASLEHINELIHINNQFYATDEPLHISAGFATAIIGEQLEQAIRLADKRMYEAKAKYYDNAGRHRNRRR